MKLSFTIEENDVVNYWLFCNPNMGWGTTSNVIFKIVIPGLAFISGVIRIVIGQYIAGSIACILAILIFIFFVKLDKWLIKNRFRRKAKNTYTKRIGIEETVEFFSDHVFVKDVFGDISYNLKEVVKINETGSNFFIRLKGDGVIIIPKKSFQDLDLIKEKWKELKIPLESNLSRKW